MNRTCLALLACLVFVTSVWGEETADPRRPGAIQTSNVPVVPDEIFSRLREFQNIRNAQFQSWSPDGHGLIVLTRFGNTAQLHRLTEPGGRREQLTFHDEPVMGARFVAGATDGAILFVASQGGNENDQVFLFEPAAYRTTRLTDGKSRHQLGPVHADGRRMIVASNARNGRDTDLYLADVREPGRSTLLYETTNQFWQPEDWSHDGKWLLLSRYVSINEGYPALFDVEAKKLVPIDFQRPAGQKVAIGEMKFSADGKRVYFTQDASGEFLQLVEWEIATGQGRILTADIPWDVMTIEVDSRSGRVAFTTNEDGYSGLYLLADGKPRRLPVPQGIIGGVKFSPDGQQLGLTWSSPTAQADAYSFDLDSNKLTRWTYSETGGLDTSNFIAPKLVRFSSFDGREVPAFYYAPRGADPQYKVPVLIGIHGGPESQYRPDFSALAQLYAGRLGIAVVFPNVRGSAGYGKTYLQLDNGVLREDSVRDIGALLDWVGRQPELDASRVAVTGGSYGGYMVLASLVHFGDRLRAGIDNVGIANWITFLERTSPYRQDLRRAEYGDERIPAMREHLAKISPAAHADKIRSALLVAHGVNDPRVPFFEAQQIAEKVRAAGRSVWTVYADNEGHGFLKKDNRDYLSAVEALFLQRHLLGEGK